MFLQRIRDPSLTAEHSNTKLLSPAHQMRVMMRVMRAFLSSRAERDDDIRMDVLRDESLETLPMMEKMDLCQICKNKGQDY